MFTESIQFSATNTEIYYVHNVPIELPQLLPGGLPKWTLGFSKYYKI